MYFIIIVIFYILRRQFSRRKLLSLSFHVRSVIVKPKAVNYSLIPCMSLQNKLSINIQASNGQEIQVNSLNLHLRCIREALKIKTANFEDIVSKGW